MKSTGIVRRIDDLGRICIPKEIRRTLGVKEGDPLEIGVNDQEIILRKYVPVNVCAVCGGGLPRRDYIEVSSVKICLSCAKTIELKLCRNCTSQIVNANISADLAAVK